MEKQFLNRIHYINIDKYDYLELRVHVRNDFFKHMGIDIFGIGPNIEEYLYTISYYESGRYFSFCKINLIRFKLSGQKSILNIKNDGNKKNLECCTIGKAHVNDIFELATYAIELSDQMDYNLYSSNCRIFTKKYLDNLYEKQLIYDYDVKDYYKMEAITRKKDVFLFVIILMIIFFCLIFIITFIYSIYYKKGYMDSTKELFIITINSIFPEKIDKENKES